MDPHAAIARTLARAAQRRDDGDFDDYAACFERDATLSVDGDDHMGRDSIRALAEAGPPVEARGRHVLAQSVVEVDEEGGMATAVTDFTVVSRDLVVTALGRYHDTLRRSPDGEWRFTAREVRLFTPT